MPFGVGRRPPAKPLDQWTIGEIRVSIVISSILGLGFLATVLMNLYAMLFRFNFLWLFLFIGFSLGTIFIWDGLIGLVKELRRRKKNAKKSDQS